MSRQDDIFKYLGIDKWHKAGYTGKGISILSMEQVKSQSKFPYVTAINGFGDDDNGHGSRVMEQMKIIAPDSNYFTCTKKGSVDDGSWKPLYLDYILKNNIPLVTTSKLSEVYVLGENREKYMQECIDNGTTFFVGAGNRSLMGRKDIFEEAKSEKYLTIGACEYNDGEAGKAFYSCEGEELDYMTIVGYGSESGTSFATNRFCAMCALVQQLFFERCGRTLYRHELEQFIRDNCKDMKTEGFDVQTGYGLFILPDPESVDVNRYISKYRESEKIVLKQQLINKDKYSLKCPYDMNAEFVVVHNTANDASAENEITYMESTSVSTSFHIAVDDVEAIQAIPFDRNAFHAGDGVEGNGNRKGIAVEICYSKSGGERFEKAKNNAIEVIADILIKRDWDITHVKKHQDFSSKYCPHRILDEGWEKFINQIQKRLEEKNMEEANKPSEWAKVAWEWGTKNGVCDGTNPKGTITREQVVQMLYNLLVKGGK